jgi:hypothetical protein
LDVSILTIVAYRTEVNIPEQGSAPLAGSLLRRVLGEKPSEHRFIVTAPGRGYRFVAAVRTRGEPRGAEAEADSLSLAILQFADRTQVAGKGYLGEAVAADLIRLLSAHELDPPLRKRFLLWYTSIRALDLAYELACNSLDHYAREGTVGGAWGVLWMPEMAPFRNDERFQLFARRLRLFECWSEYGPPDGHSLNGDRLSKAG